MDMNYVVSFLEKNRQYPKSEPDIRRKSMKVVEEEGKGLRLCGRVQQERQD